MPRIRTIKPEFASDRKMARVSREARLTFILLITQADDDGLVLGSPRQLLGQLYPHDESVDLATLSRELRELLDAGFIVMRETHEDAPVVQIANWSKHQKVDHKGKSLILNTLRPVEDTPRDILASVSRESRAPTLDLGPRTVDLGPTTPPAVAGARPPNWVDRAVRAWAQHVGVVSHGEMGKRLKPAVEQYGEEIVLVAIEKFGAYRRRRQEAGEDHIPGLPAFVRDIRTHIPRNLLGVA